MKNSNGNHMPSMHPSIQGGGGGILYRPMADSTLVDPNPHPSQIFLQDDFTIDDRFVVFCSMQIFVPPAPLSIRP